MFTMFIDAGSRDFLKAIKWCCSLAYIIIYFKFILEANIFLQQAIIYFTKKTPLVRRPVSQKTVIRKIS